MPSTGCTEREARAVVCRAAVPRAAGGGWGCWWHVHGERWCVMYGAAGNSQRSARYFSSLAVISRSFAGISSSSAGIPRSSAGIPSSFGRISRSFAGISSSFGRISSSFAGISSSFAGISSCLAWISTNNREFTRISRNFTRPGCVFCPDRSEEFTDLPLITHALFLFLSFSSHLALPLFPSDSEWDVSRMCVRWVAS